MDELKKCPRCGGKKLFFWPNLALEMRIEELEGVLQDLLDDARALSHYYGASIEGNYADAMGEGLRHVRSKGAQMANEIESILANVGQHPSVENQPPSGGKTTEVPIERLREIEWSVSASESSGREGEWVCPACDAFEANGHAPNCWLGNLLGSSEAEDD